LPAASVAVTTNKQCQIFIQRVIARSPRQHYIMCKIVEISIFQKTQEYVNAFSVAENLKKCVQDKT